MKVKGFCEHVTNLTNRSQFFSYTLNLYDKPAVFFVKLVEFWPCVSTRKKQTLFFSLKCFDCVMFSGEVKKNKIFKSIFSFILLNF